MTFSVHPLSPVIGAEIRGLDLAQPLDDATIAGVRQAWLDHAVLVFRGQNLDPDQQRRVVSYFGTIGVRSAALPHKRPRAFEGPDYNADAMLVSNIRQDGKPIGVLPDGEMWFHHDMCYSATPNRASFLYSIEIPSHGGDTHFASMCAAYDNLPQALKQRIEGKRVLQAFDEVQDRRLDLDNIPLEEVKHAWQPIVVRHPETGRRALYVNRLMSHRIEGLPHAESDALLEELYSYGEDPRVRYEHVWKVGDLVMWDNLNSMHARTDFPREERRLMRRFTISGTPVIAAWADAPAAG
jgi:taurine dioxygenase